MASQGSKFYKEFLSQTGTLASTTLFTPADDGLYLVTLYVEDLTSEDGSVTATFGWTDDKSTKSKVFQATSTQQFSALSIYQNGGSAITIQASDGGQSHTYNIFVSIESLSIKV